MLERFYNYKCRADDCVVFALFGVAAVIVAAFAYRRIVEAADKR